MVCCPHCAHWTDTSMRCRTPDVCAAVIAANLSFLACLQGLQRLGWFFSPLSWKNTCSPEVQMKFSPQSTHLIVRSGCSRSRPGLILNSRVSCPSQIISSPWVDPHALAESAGQWLRRCQRGAANFLRVSIGGRFCCWLPLIRRSGCVQSITMAKLCRG